MANIDTIKKITIVLEEQFKKKMESRSQSLSDLSRQIGKSRNYLINLFSKHKLPSLDDFFRICEVLDIDYVDLMGYYSDIFVPSDSIDNPLDYMNDRYNEFVNSPWYNDFVILKEKPRFEINLEKECETCPIIDNSMRDDGIMRGSTVLYEKGGAFDKDGQIYCFTIKGAQKQVRELYKCPGGYMVCSASIHSKNKARFVSESDMAIYGKALCVINDLNADTK